MKSRTPKVLHEILGKPMIQHVLDATSDLCPCETVIVTDPGSASLFENRQYSRTIIQQLPFGTADAVAVGLDCLSMDDGIVLVLNGDVPLVRTESLRLLVGQVAASGAALSLATFQPQSRGKYGRIRRKNGEIVGIVEAADDSPTHEGPIEANGGIYAFDVSWLRKTIGEVRVSQSGEYYLTSLVGMRSKAPGHTVAVELDEQELLGVDDRSRLARAEAVMRLRVIDRHMAAGVTVVDPLRTVIEADVEIEADVRLEPGCFLRGSTRIKSGSTIGPYSVLEHAEVGRDSVILQSWVTGSAIGDRVHVGPFARIRPGTDIQPGVHLGNFVETKATSIGEDTQVHHFSYLGDATIGSKVNIGAGTVTCNYDGAHKHRTIIGNDVFVGCDTMLVAPVELGNGSSTGAGAVVTRSVPAGMTVVGIPARPILRRETQEQEEHGR